MSYPLSHWKTLRERLWQYNFDLREVLCPAVLVKTRICGGCSVSRAHKTSLWWGRSYFVFALENKAIYLVYMWYASYSCATEPKICHFSFFYQHYGTAFFSDNYYFCTGHIITEYVITGSSINVSEYKHTDSFTSSVGPRFTVTFRS